MSFIEKFVKTTASIATIAAFNFINPEVGLYIGIASTVSIFRGRSLLMQGLGVSGGAILTTHTSQLGSAVYNGLDSQVGVAAATVALVFSVYDSLAGPIVPEKAP